MAFPIEINKSRLHACVLHHHYKKQRSSWEHSRRSSPNQLLEF